MSGESTRYKNKLDALFEKVKEIQDMELKSEWAKYLCVLVSGYLEVSIREIHVEYARRRADENVTNYVSKTLDGFLNPKMNKILELISMFNKQISDEIKLLTNGELAASVDSIVNNRHNIAHGRNTSLSYVNIKTYYDNVVKVVRLLKEKLAE
jgi:hypothetical protein